MALKWNKAASLNGLNLQKLTGRLATLSICKELKPGSLIKIVPTGMRRMHRPSKGMRVWMGKDKWDEEIWERDLSKATQIWAPKSAEFYR